MVFLTDYENTRYFASELVLPDFEFSLLSFAADKMKPPP
jgi:hypothetical protein